MNTSMFLDRQLRISSELFYRMKNITLSQQAQADLNNIQSIVITRMTHTHLPD